MYKIALEQLVHEWYHQPVSKDIEGRIFSVKDKKEEYRALKILIRDLQELTELPENQIKFDAIINKYIKNTKILSKTDLKLLFSPEMVRSTIDFYESAKAFNSEMSMADIGQAMRNVWIINMIQLLENKSVGMTKSAFGYSMLYPYTDNFIDADHISKPYKQKVLKQFGIRLSEGGGMEPFLTSSDCQENSDEYDLTYQTALNDLVSQIEGEYCRNQHPHVYSSLVGIHNAQMKSQYQHGDTMPYERPILNYTFEKGGTSVLADACLVCGSLTEDKIKFYLHYGIILQLCDDLQDMIEDHKNNHQTIYSQLMSRYPLDSMLYRTLAFNERMVRAMPDEKWKSIYQNCILMMISISSLNYKPFMTRDFYKQLMQFSPFSLRQLKKIEKEVKNLQNIVLKPDSVVLFKRYISQLSLDI